MTSNVKIKNFSKGNNVSEGFRSLIGKRMSKNYKFMDQNLKIQKLTVNEVMEVQELAKDAGSDEDKNFQVLCDVIRAGVEDSGDITNDEFRQFPLDELSKLSTEVMKFSGMQAEKGN